MMKKLFILAAGLFILTHSINAQQLAAPVTEPASSGAIMKFDSEVVDYGEILQGSEPLRVFTFKNTGTTPLIISGARGSCGCTVPSYPKEPVMPGASADIEVRYDTKRIGSFSKTVTLTTNAANSTADKPAGTFVLTIKGKVDATATEPN